MEQYLEKQITNSTAKETQIEESEARFKTLVESSPNAILLSDKAGIIQLINRQTEILFGYQRNELLGKTIEMLLPERLRKHHAQYRESFFDNPEARPMGKGRDLYALHKSGDEIAVEIGLTPLRSENKLLVLSTIVDITERKKNEEKLMQKNAELAKFNEELKARTAQLIQSEKMSALGILIAGVAHELNNPITGILNYAQYCKKNIPPEGRMAEVLDELVFEAKRCAEIVKNLLTYSYYSIPEKEAAEATVHIADVIKRVSIILGHHLKDIKVITHIEEDLPDFKIHANRLQQVIANIVKNSIDAMENTRDKNLIIKAYQEGSKCHVIIEDTGTGISHEKITKIFDPFYTTKEVGKGTGLGLCVCKSIIEEAGGDVYVESIEGQGTQFHILLPKK